MFTLRRWWDQYGLRSGLIVLVLTVAWLLRQTQVAFVLEIYQLLSRPFQGTPAQERVLEDVYIQELQQRLTELEVRNQEMQELLDYTASTNIEEVIAPVIGRSADHWWQQVVIGKGSQDGIQVGDVVSGIGGLVGRITHVTPNTSRVLLISDPTSQVGVTISRTRYMGFIQGQAEDRAVMEFFDKVPDVSPGDIVVTSAFSQLFPPGLPVGRVESVNLNRSPAPEAVIELSAPMSSLEWVTVISNDLITDTQREEMDQLMDAVEQQQSTDQLNQLGGVAP